MASQNRRDYGGYRTQSSGLAFVRGFFIMLVVLILSFGLGFFVLARFMPGSPKLENNHSGVAIASTRGENETTYTPSSTLNAQPSSRTQTPKPAAAPAPRPEAQGPIIGPGDENPVQQPGNMDAPANHDENQTDLNKAETREKPATRQKPEPKEKVGTADKPTVSDPPAPSRATGSTEDLNPPPVKPHRPGRKPTREGGETTRPHTDIPHNNETTPTIPAQPRETLEGKTPPVNGFYRVQMGAFGTREQAQQLVKEAQDKGFEAQIKVIKKDGQTLYKVQHSAHKTRANAEKEGQKLTEAGFQVYIASPEK